MEKPPVTLILEPCINQLASMRRLKNMSRNRLQLTKKLVTEAEKQSVTVTLERSMKQLENIRKRENTSRKHLP